MAASRLSLSGLRLESSTRERNQDLHSGCRLQGTSVPPAWQRDGGSGSDSCRLKRHKRLSRLFGCFAAGGARILPFRFRLLSCLSCLSCLCCPCALLLLTRLPFSILLHATRRHTHPASGSGVLVWVSDVQFTFRLSTPSASNTITSSDPISPSPTLDKAHCLCEQPISESCDPIMSVTIIRALHTLPSATADRCWPESSSASFTSSHPDRP